MLAIFKLDVGSYVASHANPSPVELVEFLLCSGHPFWRFLGTYCYVSQNFDTCLSDYSKSR